MTIFKEWVDKKTSLTQMQDQKAAALFNELKKLFAGGFQDISDVAHLPLSKQGSFKQDGKPPTQGMRGIINKLDQMRVFEKAKQISPEFGKRADDVRNMLEKDMDDAQPNPDMNVGKFINLLFGRDDTIQYYQSGQWKNNMKKEPKQQQPPMQLTPPPQPQGAGQTNPDMAGQPPPQQMGQPQLTQPMQ